MTCLGTAVLTTMLAAGVAHGSCGPVGATYAPRSAAAANGIRYRLTTYDPAPRDNPFSQRWRFELFDRRHGRRLSLIDVDYSCGMGRAPCAVWPLGKADDDSFVHSVVTALNADLSPVRGNTVPYVIIFANFGESDWTTMLAFGHVPGVRYFTRAQVQPDLSEQIVWVRTACGHW